MIDYIGWAYTGITISGSCFMAARGESKKAWGIYLASTIVGMAYFAAIADASQFVLVAIFCAMNAYAMARLFMEAKAKTKKRVERFNLLAAIIVVSAAGIVITMIANTAYTGWLYTAMTLFGSTYITTTGETRTAWGNYIAASVVGMAYFAAIANPSQFCLSLFFGISNTIAAIRLQLKQKRGSTIGPVAVL
jgi:hypothetical protein